VIVQDLLAYARQIDNRPCRRLVVRRGVTCRPRHPHARRRRRDPAFDLYIAPDRLPGSYSNTAYVVAEARPRRRDNLAAYTTR